MAVKKKLVENPGMRTFFKHEFGSVAELLSYLDSNVETYNNRGHYNVPDAQTQLELARCGELSDERFYGVSYEMAYSKLKYGDDTITKEVLQDFKEEASRYKKAVQKTVYSPVGYQVSIGRYMSGDPNNMMSTKREYKKAKIVNVIRLVAYNSDTSATEMMREGAKALAIIDMLEKQGYRVNLYVVRASELMGGTDTFMKLKLKDAGERLNIAKIAFPLCHPSYFRRICARYGEVTPEVHNMAFGSALTAKQLKRVPGLFEKNDIVIPQKIDLSKVHNLEDLQKFYGVV